jgi:hypothetical protein
MIDDEGWGVKSIHYCSISFNHDTVQVEDSCTDSQIRKHPISERVLYPWYSLVAKKMCGDPNFHSNKNQFNQASNLID